MGRNLFGVRWISAAALAACLAFGGLSAAQAEEGSWYIGANMPLMFIDDSDSNATTTFGQGQGAININSTVRSEHDTGYKLGAVLGRHLDSNLRVEGEIFLARAKVSKITHNSISLQGLPSSLPITLPTEVDVDGVSGSASQLGAMVNLWYDFDLSDTLTPYIGGGLGFIRIDQGDLRYDPNAVKNAISARAAAAAPNNPMLQQLVGHLAPLGALEVPRLSTTDTAFAFQIGAGIGYALSDSLTLHVGYRLQALNGLTFSGDNGMVSTTAETDLRVHFLEIGIRYRF